MKASDQPAVPSRGRRISGRAQNPASNDPYHSVEKMPDGTCCPDCGAVFSGGRWHWGECAALGPAQTCPACRRIREGAAGGILTLKGDFVRAKQQELLSLIHHQEELEKAEHALNRIMDIAVDDDGITVRTTDPRLACRMGDALERAYEGALEIHHDEDGFFARVAWERA
ncbi:BCAM0308 family protein [Nitrospirillum viridazoti]|uniref:ATPase n=1 Tax=Nitrospirillum amazonense TaxID=28077 RepID=A0A560HR12_9PROT|nr:BCAM0308 family protein [Nitrospirillum amazonense]TWB47674.1 hypothetical protein FBZ92_13347 [Nitrospirillum amazonense]